MKRKFISAVFSAVILAMASGGITTSAAETSAVIEEASEITLTTTADSEEIESEESSDAPDKPSVDYFGDDYYDTSGNATLIKEESIIYKSEEMQFIAVTTRDGHVFYVLINYSADSGEDNVYFLNKVDAVDLYALIYMKDEEKENGINMDNVKKAEDAAIAAFGKDKPASDTGDTDTSDTPDVTEDGGEQPVSKPMNMNSIYLVIGAVALIGIGAVAFMLTKKKSGKKQNIAYEPDESDEEDEPEIVETDDEDEMNFYDHEDDEE